MLFGIVPISWNTVLIQKSPTQRPVFSSFVLFAMFHHIKRAKEKKEERRRSKSLATKGKEKEKEKEKEKKEIKPVSRRGSTITSDDDEDEEHRPIEEFASDLKNSMAIIAFEDPISMETMVVKILLKKQQHD